MAIFNYGWKKGVSIPNLRAKVVTPRAALLNARIKTLRVMLGEGHTTAEIADALGISAINLRSIAKRAGISLRRTGV